MRLVGRVLVEDIAQQMLDLQKKLQNEALGSLGKASSNLTAGSPSVDRP